MAIRSPTCGKDDFKGEGRISSHISLKHSCDTDGKGSRPSTGTHGSRDSGAKPKTPISCHKDQERQYSDIDIVKDVARVVQRDSLQRRSQQEVLFKVKI